MKFIENPITIRDNILSSKHLQAIVLLIINVEYLNYYVLYFSLIIHNILLF